MKKWSRFLKSGENAVVVSGRKNSIPAKLSKIGDWWVPLDVGNLPKESFDLLSKTSKICLFGGEEKTPKYIPQMMGSKMVVNYHGKR